MKRIQRNGLISLIGFLCSLTFISCEKEENKYRQSMGDANHWIDSLMRKEYYWSDEIPETGTLNFKQDTESFFYRLLSLKDGKTRSDHSHYYYSWIKKREAGTKSIHTEQSYGFEFMIYREVDENGKVTGNFLPCILYLLPSTPASEAKLQRGDLIVKMDGKAITSSDQYMKLYGSEKVSLEINRWSDAARGFRTLTIHLEAARKVEDNPLFLDTVYQKRGKNIGYLVYNHFTTGPTDGNDHTYDNQMRDIFTKFKANEPDEFVLDLRYNGGGYLTSSELLASMLVPAKNLKDTYCIIQNNKGKEDSRLFISGVANLDLKRVYVLVSDQTASASEAVINGLRAYMEVILIGVQTEGKNVGSVNFVDSRFEWELQPITLKILNSKRQSDYAQGFNPDYLLDELDGNVLRPLGDSSELLLNKAFELMGTPSASAAFTTQSAKPLPMQVVHRSLDRKKTNGVLVTPTEN